MTQATEQDLKEWTQYDRASDLEKWLKNNGIPFFYGKGGCIITTWEAVNSRLISGETSKVEFL